MAEGMQISVEDGDIVLHLLGEDDEELEVVLSLEQAEQLSAHIDFAVAVARTPADREMVVQ